MKKISTAIVFALGSISQVSAAEPNFHLPVVESELPFFPTSQEAEKRLTQYDTAIEQLDDDVDECESDCEKLEQRLDDYEFSRKKHIEKNGLPLMSVIGGPGYMPETGLMLAIGGLYSFKVDRDIEELQRSSISLVGITNQLDDGLGFGIRSKQNVFFDEKLRYFGKLQLGDQNQYYWGVGHDAGKRFEASDSLLMDYRFLNYDADLTYLTDSGIHVGPIMRVRYFDAIQNDLPDTALNDASFQAYKDKPLSVGLGVTLQYDSRDVAVNAWQGQFVAAEYIQYDDVIGSDSDYQKASLQYRYYYSFAQGRVLATYNKVQWSHGDVPFYDLPTVGGQDSMRGIYQGHYRDLNAVENTVEYRHAFKSGQYLSNHGVTLWAGVGSVAPDIGELYEELLYSYGIGYRYELQPRMNVRVDYGVGPNNENGFYLTFTEAF